MRTHIAVLIALSVAGLGCTTLSIGQLRPTQSSEDAAATLVCGEFAEDSVAALNRRLEAIYRHGLRLAATGTISHSFLGIASAWQLLCFEGPASGIGLVDGRSHASASAPRPTRR